MVYSVIAPSTQHWGFKFNGMRIGASKFRGSRKSNHVIIDSGASYTLVPLKYFKQLVREYKKYGLTECKSINYMVFCNVTSLDVVGQLPDISFQLQNQVIVLKAEHFVGTNP